MLSVHMEILQALLQVGCYYVVNSLTRLSSWTAVALATLGSRCSSSPFERAPTFR